MIDWNIGVSGQWESWQICIFLRDFLCIDNRAHTLLSMVSQSTLLSRKKILVTLKRMQFYNGI